MNRYEDIVMLEQHRHLANKCEDIVNLQGAEAYCVATRTACLNGSCTVGVVFILNLLMYRWKCVTEYQLVY